MPNALFTTAQVAQELELDISRVIRLAKSRGLGTQLASRQWVFTKADIDAMRERRPGRPPKAVPAADAKATPPTSPRKAKRPRADG